MAVRSCLFNSLIRPYHSFFVEHYVTALTGAVKG